MKWSEIGALLNSVDSSWTLFAVIVFAFVWFFRSPLDKLIEGIIPGEHATIARNIIKNVFVFGLLGIILVSALQAQKQSNEYQLQTTKINLPVEMKKLDIKSEDFYGLTSATINSLLSEFEQNEIGLDIDIEVARTRTRLLINRVLQMKADLIYALNANEDIRKRAIEALNLLDTGDLKQVKDIHGSMLNAGVFDKCSSVEPINSVIIEPEQSAPTLSAKIDTMPQDTLSQVEEVSDSHLKKLRFLLATYGHWKILTGSSGIKIYPSTNEGADLMMLRERECASEVGISSALDNSGLHYLANEREGECFAGGLQSVELKGANVLGLNVDSLLAQYKRIDGIANDIYDDIVYSNIKMFEPSESIGNDYQSLEQLRYIVKNSYSSAQIKFLGKLYFVYGLTTTEIRDIPFPNNKVTLGLDSKIADAQTILLSDNRTRDLPLVSSPIAIKRSGYNSEETTKLSGSTVRDSTPLIAPPKPPTIR